MTAIRATPNAAFPGHSHADTSTAAGVAAVDPATMTLTELADHIESTHHAYLRQELPRLVAQAGSVAAEHGVHDSRLHGICRTLVSFASELSNHMQKEEMVLFPMIRQLEKSDRLPRFHCGSLANPIRQMELEHSDADAALMRLRELSDDYTLPSSACDACRSLRESLLVLERDMHAHIDKENGVLFPRAMQLEATKTKATADRAFV